MIEFVSDLLEEYKLSFNKEHEECLLQDFKNELWNSKFNNYKYKKRIHYQVKEELLGNQQLIDLFNKYNDIKYSVEKSYHKNRNKISSIDYIRIHINNLYSKLFDKDTYLPKEYYECLFIARNLYFKTIKLSKQEQKALNINSLEDDIINSLKLAEEIKNIHIREQKCELSFGKYKKLINGYIDSLFENYIIFDEYKEKNGWDYSKIATTIVFGEENYTIRYFNKSISGYLRNYFRKEKGIKRVLDSDGNVLAMFKVDKVLKEFSVMQIGVSRFYKSKDELLKIDDRFYRQLTPKQKEFLDKIKGFVDVNDILFYENGLPYFKLTSILEKSNIPVTNIQMYFESVYNRINEIKNNRRYKFCECCGSKIKIRGTKDNSTKYCSKCTKKIKNLQNLKYYNLGKAKS